MKDYYFGMLIVILAFGLAVWYVRNESVPVPVLTTPPVAPDR